MTMRVEIPAINDLLALPEVLDLMQQYSRERVVVALRHGTQLSRERQIEAGLPSLTAQEIANEARNFLIAETSPTLKRVINGTGTVLHTNLGRAKLAASAKKALEEVAFNFSNVEYTLETGQRGSRYSHVEALLKKLTGAQAALVVNNNAAAVLLTLHTLAQGKEVIVSRGELVEIGGSFRIPEIMALGGCVLKEVGTTNKTHLKDYQQAVSEETALLLKVHTSNYRIQGFTASVTLEELKETAKQAGLPLVYDMGSGALLSLEAYGVPQELTVQETIAAGADIVTFSGDKLLGGPQAGIILGKKAYIDRLKANQLTRALRIDKLTIAALEATLLLYLDTQQAVKEIPTLQMLTVEQQSLKEKALQLEAELQKIASLRVTLREGVSQVGGGAMPTEELATWLVAIQSPLLSTTELVNQLRQNEVPIITRVKNQECLIDIRTIEEEEIPQIVTAVAKIIKRSN